MFKIHGSYLVSDDKINACFKSTNDFGNGLTHFSPGHAAVILNFVIFKLIWRIDFIVRVFYETDLKWMPQDLTDR